MKLVEFTYFVILMFHVLCFLFYFMSHTISCFRLCFPPVYLLSPNVSHLHVIVSPLEYF